MDFWVITTIICFIGWMITLYIYSKTFKNAIDTSASKIKDKAQDIASKDNRKNDV